MPYTSVQACTAHHTCYYNPHGCPYGYFGDPTRECTCSASTIARSQKRISGPLLDRIAIHVEVPRFEYEKLTDWREGERSAAVRARVQAARERQVRRFGPGGRGTCNTDMGPAEVQRSCEVEAGAQPLLRAAMQRLQLSAQAFHRVLKLARTIADLAGTEQIGPPRRHVLVTRLHTFISDARTVGSGRNPAAQFANHVPDRGRPEAIGRVAAFLANMVVRSMWPGEGGEGGPTLPACDL